MMFAVACKERRDHASHFLVRPVPENAVVEHAQKLQLQTVRGPRSCNLLHGTPYRSLDVLVQA